MELEDKILKQIKNENDSYNYNYNKKFDKFDYLNSSGVNNFIIKVIEKNKEELNKLKKLKKFKDNELLKNNESETIIYFLIISIFKNLTKIDENGYNKSTIQNNVKSLLKHLVNNYNYKRYKKEDKVYFDLINSYKKGKNGSYIIKSLDMLFKKNRNIEKYNYNYEDYKVFLKIFMLIIKNSNSFKINNIYIKNGKNIKTKILIDFEYSIKKIINDINNKSLNLVQAYPLPMISKPLKYSYDEYTGDFKVGGYYTSNINYDLIKSDYIVEDNYKNKELLNSLNKLMLTPYKVNNFVLEVFNSVMEKGGKCGIPNKEGINIPLDRFKHLSKEEYEEYKKNNKEEYKELKRKSAEAHQYNSRIKQKNIGLNFIKIIANLFKNEEEIYFVYNVDYRMRTYVIQYFLSPQGNEISKALLDFKEYKELKDENGLNNLKYHIANTFGKDKLLNEEKLKWFNENENDIFNTGNNPYEFKMWEEADEPFSFLRASHEYYLYKNSGLGYKFKSNLICHVDGKCNGTQHMSALALDKVAAESVNVIGKNNNDLYSKVLKIVLEKIEELIKKDINKEEYELLNEMFEKTDRGLIKRNVMTLSYSATLIGMKKQILAELKSRDDEIGFGGKYFKTGNYFVAQKLSKLNIESMKKVIKSVFEIQNYLKKSVEIFYSITNNKVLTYKNACDFTVVQNYKKEYIDKIDNYINKIRILNTVKLKKDEVSLKDNLFGISPNFIHSYDASHLCKTVNNFHGNISVIHDSFGTHACDVENLKIILKEQFIKIYKKDNLYRFRKDLIEQAKTEEQKEKLDKELPIFKRYNDFEIEEVLDSVYMFS